MLPATSTRALISLGFLLSAAVALAQPVPSDVYREYNWRPNSKWQRVTGPDAAENAGHPGASRNTDWDSPKASSNHEPIDATLARPYLRFPW